ncbi:GNAT family N-acetyltransferase [Patescibacteria group bacterium]
MIRLATLKDANRIRSLIRSVEGCWDESWRINTIELGIKSSDGLVFVFEKEEKILGFICAHDVGFRGYISELIVSPNAQKQGIGKALLQKIEEELQKRGCKTIIADVWKCAEGFYEKMDWSKPDVTLLRKKL